MLLSITTLSFTGTHKSITDNQIQGRLNIVNGEAAECVMHKFYTNSGWTQIEGEVGRNGIDGLYFKKKNGVIKEVLVSESKWNTSGLGRSGKDKAVKQMSQEWVLRTMDKLIKKNPKMPYATLKRFIENDQYRARLFRLKPLSNNQIQITIYKVKNKGLKSFDTLHENTLKPIIIGHPRNGFEHGILESYTRCRVEVLERYFPMLDKGKIKVLLSDNYLQKSDVKELLGQ